MKLIALTGDIGTGKTEMLVSIADRFKETGRTVDGFCARASGRVPGGNQAARYDLTFIADGGTIPFAVRDESLFPPYRFHRAASEAVRQWAADLTRKDPLDLIILDEFGPVEALGGGHLVIWPDIHRAAPDFVIIATREWLVETIEKKLGQRFFRRFDAGDANAQKAITKLLNIG